MKKITIAHTIRVMLPIAVKVAPVRFFLINFFGIAQSAVLAVNTLLLSRFVDALIASVSKGEVGESLILWISLYVAGIIGYQIFNTLFNYILDEYREICNEKFRFEYNRAVSDLSPIEFEHRETLDEIQKAEAGRNVAHVFIFHIIGIIDMVPPYVIFMCFYVSSLNSWLLLCIIAAFLPAVFTLYMQRGIYTKLEDTAAPVRRRYYAFKDCIIGRQFLKETRILGAGNYFYGRVAAEWERLRREERKVKKQTTLLETIDNTVGLTGYLAALILLVASVLQGTISVGAFAAVYNSLNNLFDMMFALVCGFIGSTVSNLPAVENYVSFLERRRKSGREEGKELDLQRGIVLDHVSFSYPNASAMSIKDINIHIQPGQYVAVVGENGAGKSTLAKLILGLYPTGEGRIEIGGVKAEDTWYKSCRKCMSAVFQNFVRYQMTLSDNVKISERESEENPKTVLESTSLDRGLVDGCNVVMLSREFGGIDLSGGMWQQVAIARGRYRSHEIIVLDEPTAAIDPVEEYTVYRNFLRMAKGKTAVIISHRLGSARLADRILVMSGGRIVEDGTHEELLSRNGLYREMWDAQAASYQ